MGGLRPRMSLLSSENVAKLMRLLLKIALDIPQLHLALADFVQGIFNRSHFHV